MFNNVIMFKNVIVTNIIITLANNVISWAKFISKRMTILPKQTIYISLKVKEDFAIFYSNHS